MAGTGADLDLRPLTARSGLGARLRAVWSNNLSVLGAVIATILVLVPSVVFVSLLATDRLTDGGAIALMAMLVGAGAFTWVSLLRQAGAGSAMARFAEVNRLDLLEARISTDYAARPFATGTHLVHRAVRTRGSAYVEVGERHWTGQDTTGDGPSPLLYLRVRLAEPVAWDVVPEHLLDDGLAGRLAAFAAPYDVEVSGREVTVLGGQPLGATTEGRVAEAFALVRELEARGRAAAVPAGDAASTPSGVWVPPERPEQRGRRLHPLAMVAGLLGLLVAVPLGVALVLSVVVTEPIGNRFVATLVVVPVVWVIVAVVRGAIRLMLRPR